MGKTLASILSMIDPGKSLPDRKVLVVLVTIPVVLTLSEYWGQPRSLFQFLRAAHVTGDATTLMLLGNIYWSCCCFLCYMVIPALVMRIYLDRSVLECGLKMKGITRHLGIYAALFLAVFPFIVIASFGRSFQATYPFFMPGAGKWPLFLLFELFYLAQFLYLEFFFRGYILFNLEKQMGYYSVLVMTIPYCMIHYHKPFLEAMAAIVAGIVLGTLALRTRSIWYGVLIHVSVALSMDIISLLQKGMLIRIFVP